MVAPVSGLAYTTLDMSVDGAATELTRAYVAATEERSAQVLWDLAEEIAGDARGIPRPVSVAARLAQDLQDLPDL